MLIELINEKHFTKVFQIEKTSFPKPRSIENLRCECSKKNSFFFVATEKDDVVGYINFNYVLDEGHITYIVVTSKYRRLGVGKQLISHVINIAKENKVKTITLEVRISNIPAISLYSLFGFKKVGTRKKYYKLPEEDASLMTVCL